MVGFRFNGFPSSLFEKYWTVGSLLTINHQPSITLLATPTALLQANRCWWHLSMWVSSLLVRFVTNRFPQVRTYVTTDEEREWTNPLWYVRHIVAVGNNSLGASLSRPCVQYRFPSGFTNTDCSSTSSMSSQAILVNLHYCKAKQNRPTTNFGLWKQNRNIHLGVQ